MATFYNDNATASLTASSTGTAVINARRGGYVTYSVSGTFSGTIALQRSPDNTNWYTVTSVTTPTEGNSLEPWPGMWYRLYCSAYTSGTAVCSIYYGGVGSTIGM